MIIAICEDEQCYVDAIRNSIFRWKDAHNISDIHVDTYYSTEDLWEDINKHYHCDILFLDIQIPNNMSGFKLAQLIRENDNYLSIVFVTNSKQYILSGYEISALRYVTKPFSDKAIWEPLSIVYERHVNK